MTDLRPDETAEDRINRFPSIERGSLVIAYLANPKERVWGVLLQLDGPGIVIRGLDLNSVEDWIAQERADGEKLITPSTQFVPTHRLERIYADERTGNVASYGERFATACDREARDTLLGDDSQ
jgi:hypothetical protein